ncbi:MAG: 5'/3'-nucleotidase SurE [Desulfitobacteriaceae bacterium]|nr:5'/3'-nucleotidase SurE [Desulfitobacteriaceae bacterium]MDD4346991.1 5'/3'-nucleotidase SurE [Desulfitobacteriaceae bacterium]MDD4401720.1 5'/3'-nucleotidase SurE [Desulfitobacteriaceae bacterium]
MQILLTNDDGYYARGLQTLYKILLKEKNWDLSIVAPEGQRSAVGHAITLFNPIMVREHTLEGNKRGFSIRGTPSDCVKLAIQGKIVPSPDLIVSGINSGANIGTDVFYSGTVSAALEGVFLGIPSIAVSLAGYKKGSNFEPAAEFIINLLPKLLERPYKGLININIPAKPENNWSGVRVTKLGKTVYEDVFESRLDPRGRRYFWQSGTITEDQEKDTDLNAIQEGYVSITPLHCDLTDYEKIKDIEDLGKYI